MAIDEQAVAKLIGIDAETGQVNLTYRVQRQRRQVSHRVATVVHAGDVHIVDIEQQPTAGSAYDLVNEVGFFQGRGLELQVGSWVFQQDVTT
ncbi:hypothetical protein D3C75_1205410 [compost metagenome]